MRNLKIGDNLNGKRLYFSFPNIISDFFENDYSPSSTVLFETDLGYSFVANAYYNGSLLRYQVRCYENGYIYSEIDEVYVIEEPDNVLINVENCILPDDFGTIISLDTSTQFNQYIQIEPEIKIIIDKQPKSNATKERKSIILKTERLLKLEDICDELRFNSSSDLSIIIIRKLSVDSNGNIVVLEEPVEEVFSDIDFTLFEGENYIYLEETDCSSMYMKYLNTSKFNEVYPSKSEATSLISKSNDNILLKVLEKMDGKQIVSLINLYPEAIKILSSKIGMEGYVSINKNFRIDEKGTAYMKNCVIEGGILKLIDGAEIVTEKGLLTNLQFIGIGRSDSYQSVAGEFNDLGFKSNDGTDASSNLKTEIILNADIPSDFTVKKATIRFVHAPVNYSYENDYGVNYFWGYSRNVRLYKTTDLTTFYRRYAFYSEVSEIENVSYEEIENAFGQNGFTASVPTDSSHSVQTVISKDISSSLISGKLNRLRIASGDQAPTYNGDEWYGNMKVCAEQTGVAMAILNIIGYKKFN